MLPGTLHQEQFMLKSGEKFRKLLTLLITWGLLMACFIGYEQYYAKGQERYLQDSELRDLTALSNELTSRFDQARISADSSIKLLAAKNLVCSDLPGQSDKDQERECLRQYLHLYFRGAWNQDRDPSTRNKSLDAAIDCKNSGLGHSVLQFAAKGLTLNVSCPVTAEQRKATSSSGKEQGVPIYSFDLEPWIRTAFEQLDGNFNDLLVADSTGHVVFQQSTDGPRVGDLTSLLPDSTSKDGNSNKDGNSKGSGASSSASATNDQSQNPSKLPTTGAERSFQKLLEDTAITPIVLADRNYQLFSQPVRVLNLSPDSEESNGKESNMVVCGLQDANWLREQSHNLPYSALIWATLILVAVFSLSWPLFKLRYMSNTERFSLKDGWYLILAIFLASTSLMLMLLNASYTSWARDGADRNLKRIADQIKHNFPSEMTSALGQLQQLSPDASQYTLKKTEEPILISNYPILHPPGKPCYPYFEMANYADRQGQQILKLDMRNAPTPAINVGTRAFFNRVIGDETWGSETSSQPETASAACDTVAATSIGRNYVEPLISKNTHEFFAVLSSPFPAGQVRSPIAVQALSIKPISLVNPVLPPGYQFAVIDANCEVLFHSDSFRNMRENFCQNSKYKDELRPWLFSGADTWLQISYGGHAERAYLTIMPDRPQFTVGQAFLIVFREPDVDLTLNLAIILVSSILMGVYFSLVLSAAIAHLALRGPLCLIYAPRFIWPCRESALSYVELFALNGFMLLLFWLFYRRIYEGPLLTLTFAVALLSILFFIVKQTRPRKGLPVLGAFLIGVALTGWLASRHYPSSSLSEWGRVFWFLGITGFAAIVLSGVFSRIHLSAGWQIAALNPMAAFVRKHFKKGYVLAALSVIAASAFVPCIGSFKYAYDAVSELSLKHDQLKLADSLIARRDRIRKYYSESVHSPISSKVIAQLRLSSTMDRYDTATLPGETSSFFAVGYEPDNFFSESADPSNSSVPRQRSEDPKNPVAETINRRIETAIAGATLYFPSNRLGAEMSKLGVASTEKPGRDSFHFWREVTPTRFQLSQKIEPGSPELTITSEYQDWQGLRWVPVVCLVLLGGVLTAWLMNLVRKIFFTDIENTRPFPVVDWKDVAEIDKNFLVIGWAKSGKSNWLKSITGMDRQTWFDLRVELRKKIEDPNYQFPIGQQSVLVLDHFEFNIKDSVCNAVRLNLLETLLFESTVNVVIISTVDPIYFLTEGSPDVLSHDPDPAVARDLLERWARALSKLAKVRPKDSEDHEFHDTLAAFVEKNQHCVDFAAWVRAECNATMMLRKIGKDLLSQFQADDCTTPSVVWNNVLERADTYYHTLWSGFTSTERLVLYQLAFDGWANPQNAVAIQQLERKLVIHKHPMYRIVNESFRLFIRSNEHADEITEWRRRDQQSTWHAFRFVILGLAVAAGGWLLYTQAAFSQTVANYIAGITAFLTATAGLFARFGRQGASTPKES
jgi:hypothetical protein